MEERKAEIIGTSVGAVSGAVGCGIFGTHVGIALLGTAISGALPLAAAGCLLVGLIGNKIGSEIDRSK